MPDHHTAHALARHRAEITAVGALDLGAAHLKGAALIQHLVDAFDQQSIAWLAKNNHIAGFDFTSRERKTRGQDIIALTIVRMKAVAADF